MSLEYHRGSNRQLKRTNREMWDRNQHTQVCAFKAQERIESNSNLSRFHPEDIFGAEKIVAFEWKQR